ncbi:hypothetical protein [Sphingomonas sp. Leaf412]|uniref:hypothetical protein n=1 Tax=Sphingomonas sp. Leaf412 TaxID=1736370 RepID=UPI000AD618C7|nr:hypothetical protein [Sphingomonas sp. Leaf412]
MNAPLTRDQQIAMMKTARERHLSRFAGWMGNRTIRDAVGRPAPGQDAEVVYDHETRRVSCR